MTTETKKQAAEGDKVRFDADEGVQTGLLKHFLQRLWNGKRIAIVKIDHPTLDIYYRWPADQLEVIA